MKKSLIIVLLTVTFYMGSLQSVKAVAFTCINCATWVQDLINYARQGLQYATEVSTTGFSGITALQTTVNTINNTVLLPMKDALTMAAMVTSGDQIENLILGGLGNDSLLVRNPEGFVENEGNKAIKRIIDGTPSDFYGGSIKDYLVQTYSNTDVDSRIKSLAQSSLPTTVQNNLCDDKKLTARSIADVQDVDGTYKQEDATARKTALYNNFCKCDPVKDKACAKNITSASNQDPSICGTDCLFKITNGGENEYARVVQASIIAGEQKEKAQVKTKTDLTAGGGIKSKTDCPDMSAYIDPTTGEAALDENNNPVTPPIDIPCSVSQGSAGLRSLWDQHLKSPLDSMRSSLSGLSSILSTGFTTLNLLNGISGAIGTIGGSEGSGGGVVRYSNPIKTSYTPNLAQNPALKESAVRPAQGQFGTHLDALTSIESTTNNYIAQINLYKSQLERIPGCYTALVNNFASSSPNLKNNADVVAAYSLYDSQKLITNNLLLEKNSVFPQIDATRAVINEIKTKIEASQSTEEINDLFNNYQNKMDTNNALNLIGLTKATIHGINLKGDLTNYTQTVQTELADTGSTGGTINRCASLRAEEQAKIDALNSIFNAG